MSKVFIVTEGEYSAYHIEGVFSTQEKAEEFAKKVGGNVVAYDIDGRELEQSVTVYEVVIDLDGNLVSESTREELLVPGQVAAGGGQNGFEGFYGFSTKGPKHALKLAAEQRQSTLRCMAESGQFIAYNVAVDIETGEILSQKKVIRWPRSEWNYPTPLISYERYRNAICCISRRSFKEAIEAISNQHAAIRAAFAI